MRWPPLEGNEDKMLGRSIPQKCRGGSISKYGRLWSILVNCGEELWGIVDEPSWYGMMVVGMVWYGQVQFGMVWYVHMCRTTLANGKEGRRRPTHEDVHLSFLKVGQKAEPAAG